MSGSLLDKNVLVGGRACTVYCSLFCSNKRTPINGPPVVMLHIWTAVMYISCNRSFYCLFFGYVIHSQSNSNNIQYYE